MASRISTSAVALAGAGAATVWLAMRGVSLGSGFRTLLSGNIPASGDSLLMTADSSGGGGGTLGPFSDSGVVGAAMRYVGSGSTYRWGGGSPAGWDCSGFVNYVLCHDLGLNIPGYSGGTFSGSGHGPVVYQYFLWSGCTTISRGEVQAGDLLLWPTVHMGIAVDNTSMVNCPGPNGTPAPIVSRIDGAASGPLVCRRLVNTTPIIRQTNGKPIAP